MEGLTQGRGAVVFMTVMMYTQPGLLNAVTGNNANGDCGLRYVQINKWTTKEAKSTERWDDPICQLVYKAVPKDTLYLIFKKFDVKDCKLKLGVYWGAEQETKSFDCKTSPKIDHVYYVDGQYNLTVTVEKADVATDTFDIQFELTTNDTVISPATSLVHEKMSLVGVLTIVLGAVMVSAFWRQ